MRTVVLVEGESDRIALETLASRLGLNLAGDAVEVVPIAGAHAISRSLRQLAGEPHVRVLGLGDAGEEPVFRRALELAGRGRAGTREELEELGFYLCAADLEDELIRAVGPARVVGVIEAQGELTRFRTMQSEPHWRDRGLADQVKRFIANSYRKARYARLLVEALDPGLAPRPLEELLRRATSIGTTP